MNKHLLQKILSQPTVPYRESLVASVIMSELDRHCVPFFSDPVGNLVIGAESLKAYRLRLSKRSSEPLRLFMAHMDHPGFHGIQWENPKRLHVKWHGGSPTRGLAGSQVWLATRGGFVGTGRLSEIQMTPSRNALEGAVVQLASTEVFEKCKRARELFGAFKFRSEIWNGGQIIYTKAADDLVGSFVVLELALKIWGSKKRFLRNNFVALLTRAEEVGFIGAIGHFELGWLQKARRPVLCVSVETSRTFPGAEIGKGPVIRLGDRTSIFDPDGTQWLSQIANKCLSRRHQRRIMDGGTCEATAATAFGIKAVGLSIPLGNYHNTNFNGGPDSNVKLGPAPEFVSARDIESCKKLCFELVRSKMGTKPWHQWRFRFSKMRKQAERLLGGT
ncbi:MAG: hypothetical protein HY537_06345 [Deltaproteobacteria bacterium]|nr:hypothetical protein [Deltaproteobacteria bacterium]